jgi:hypothetical protein
MVWKLGSTFGGLLLQLSNFFQKNINQEVEMFMKSKGVFFKIIVIAMMALVMASSCQRKSTEKEPEVQDYKGTAWNETNDSNFQIVGMNENGSMVGIKIANDGTVEQAAFFSDENSTGFFVWIGDDGLPYRAYINGYLILFDNFTSNTVDMAVIAPDGQAEIFREVVVDFPVSPTELSYHNLLHLYEDLSTPDAWKWSTVLKWAGHGLALGGCAASVIVAGGSLGTLTPLAALGCSSAIIGVMIDVLDVDNEYIELSSNAFGTTISALGCTNLAGCTTYVLGLALNLGQDAAEFYEEHEDTVDALEGALKYGYGDVQVTLTWNNTSDLDLWVTDPYGEKIYYLNSTSASGGQLDVDDINGYGPENIFWPTGGAPEGRYTVQVDYYSGIGTAYYTVLIQVNGRATQYTGYISEDQTVYIASFYNYGYTKTLPSIKEFQVTVHEKRPPKDH